MTGCWTLCIVTRPTQKNLTPSTVFASTGWQPSCQSKQKLYGAHIWAAIMTVSSKRNKINISMKTFPAFFLLILLLTGACQTDKKTAANDRLFHKSNLVAWCVVPFDST